MANTKVYIVPDATGKQRSAYPAGDFVAVNAPSSFDVTVSDQTVTLAWGDTNSGASETVLYVSGDSGGPFAIMATKAAGQTSHTQTIQPGTYWFYAAAKISGIESAKTSTISRTVANPFAGLAVGDLLTITGSGFGESTATVFAIDFESAAVDAALSTLGFSTDVSSTPNPTNRHPYVTDTDSYSGTRSAVADITTGGNCAAFLTGLDVEELYISLHVKYVRTSGSPETIKGVRWHSQANVGGSGENIYTAYPGVMCQEPIGYGSLHHRLQINFGQTGAASERDIDYGPADIAGETWTRQQYHYRLSTAGVADGFLRYWQGLGNDAGLASIRNNFMTRMSGITETIYTIMMPFYSDTGGYWYYDNVVIHHCATGNSGAACRIEIGDSPAYESATKREVMKREAWSDTSASARIMSHTFGPGTAYAYVIGNDGNVLATQQITLA